MNLISCDHCATVLDANKINFPSHEQFTDEKGVVNIDLFEWTGCGYAPKIQCPACHHSILDYQSIK